MIITGMETAVIPRPPTLPPAPFAPPKRSASRSSSTSQGFRLMEDQGDTGSVYSLYKQKIDSMFEPDTSPTSQNSVQARIEKMFSDVAEDHNIPLLDRTVHSFSVDYLGSVGLGEKVGSLAGLQAPLKDLYFAYKKNAKPKKGLTGRLEISSVGLRVLYQGEKGDLEQLNSFPTIAVWSAVKFVIQDGQKVSYAFLPLITDPDNIDKKTLFRQLEEGEKRYITKEAHSPLFAVVMRKIGVQKQLECHGFVCQTSEDAIVIAATLYKSLMSHMKAKEKRPKNRNGITCMSIASSAPPQRPPRKKRSTASSIISETENIDTFDTQPLIQNSKTSPKKSTKSRRAPKSPEDVDAILPYEEPVKVKETEIKPKTFTDQFNTFMSREQRQITAEIKQVMSESTNRGLKPVKEDSRKKEHSGDILTKVTIPRSGSFLNAGGLTRYKSKVYRSNGQATGGSPLGFNELFNEFRLQEGLNSLDEILGVIIDPEGMSFNDLKPIYKEFLLKLSVALTKDELYQRSKSIMRRHRKKLMRTNLARNRFKKLKHIFKKNLKQKMKNEVAKPEVKLPESSLSSSSYDTRHFAPKEEKKHQFRKKERRERTSTSEESDFFSIRRRNKINSVLHNQNRNSSSGYVSCSECSYDSDTCTCKSADKCYCSLGNKNNNLPKKCECENGVVFCGCDTDSCTESNKCYCQSVRHKKLCKRLSNTRSTRSLEYMHNPMESYYEKVTAKARSVQGSRRKGGFGLDYDLFAAQNARRAIYAAALKEGIRKEAMRNVQSTAINGACTDALSVKKSAEIAALFADVRLSQTTDIAHLNPRTMQSLVSTRNVYNKIKSQTSNVKAIQNRNAPKPKLYSTRNGLYTIQSQSDDSRRSSISEGKRNEREYFELEPMGEKKIGNNLENSLGYLP